jgi:Raf kinase inhibitor-like YbhB/YbcL family protein
MVRPETLFRTIGVLTALLCAACSSSGDEPTDLPQKRDVLEVSSPAFEDGDTIPQTYTCDGDDVSPAIEWTGAKDTDEYVLVMVDPDAGDFVHWLLTGIDAQRSSVGEGEPPSEAIEGVNSFGDTGYSGPCPPEGDDAHTYEITVLALNREIDLASDVSYGDLLEQIDCCLEASGTIEVQYSR